VLDKYSAPLYNGFKRSNLSEGSAMSLARQLVLFENGAGMPLPSGYGPRRPGRFEVARIVLAKGSLDTPERERFVRGICEVYTGVPVVERLAVAHNRIEVPGSESVERIKRGKRTLVVGELSPKNAVWRYGPRSTVYDHEWCFSVYGFCPYNCAYCYLGAVPGIWYSPAVRIYVNLPEIVSAIDRQATAVGRPVTFYLGTLQDGLALDPLTAYSTVLIPFFAGHRYARCFIQTKSADVRRLLDLEHNGHTVVSWTLSPREIAERFETNAPRVGARLAAMEACAAAGYPVCANFIPVVPCGDWEAQYLELAREVLDRVPLRRLALGGACMKHRAIELLEARKGKDNAISSHLAGRASSREGEQAFYSPGLCDRLFRQIAELAERFAPCRAVFDAGHGGTLALSFRRNDSYALFPN